MTDKFIYELLFSPFDENGFPVATKPSKKTPQSRDDMLGELAIIRGIPEWYRQQWKQAIEDRQQRLFAHPSARGR